jgi:CelD/BcsL family acetyltransferase involved in cellulose biosynthesis
MLRVLEIKSLRELENIRDAWQNLHAKLANPSVFLSYGWFYVCVKNVVHEQGTPLILTVHSGDRLIGIAPLIQKRAKVRGLPVRQIEFLTTPLTPFVDFLLLEPENSLSAITEHLLHTRKSWDVLSFGKFKEDCSNLRLLISVFMKSGCQVRDREVARVPFLRLDTKWDDFYQSKSRKFRMTRRSVANRLKRLGTITVERARSADDADPALKAMLCVSGKGWKHRQGKDLLTPEIERSLLTDLTRIAAREGWLNIWLLKYEDNVLAAEYHVKDDGAIYGLRAQYDEAYAAYSPGRYLDYEIVEQLFRDGCTYYDMGPGAAEYKLAWTEQTYGCRALEVYKPSLYSKFVYRLQHVWVPDLKRTRVGRWMARRENSRAERD